MGSRHAPVECFFDGACRGNQFAAKGPMWVAYVVGSEEHVHEIPDLLSSSGPARTNNIAEYQALIRLLRRLHELDRDGLSHYAVSGDSQLVVYQMLGRYHVQDAKLLGLHQEAQRLASGLNVTFRWVPRERNRAGHLLE